MSDGVLRKQLLRRREEGASDEVIVQELRAQGHDTADIAAVFAERRQRQQPMLRVHAPRPPAARLAAGLMSLIIGLGLLSSGFLAVFGAGLILWGLASLRQLLRGSLLTAEQTAAGLDGIREVSANDPQPRCATHDSYPSIGTCPRCGTFVCAACMSVDGGQALARWHTEGVGAMGFRRASRVWFVVRDPTPARGSSTNCEDALR